MSKWDSLPQRNRYGLVIPPTPITSPKKKLLAKESDKLFITRHHIYWPHEAFKRAGSLALEFCNHQYNSVGLTRWQHDNYHAKYDNAVIRKYVGELVPEDDVMLAFLEEAKLLERLGVSMRAVDMIDEAIYEERVKRLDQTVENRQAHLEFIASGITKAINFELIRPEKRKVLLQSAAEFMVAKAA